MSDIWAVNRFRSDFHGRTQTVCDDKDSCFKEAKNRNPHWPHTYILQNNTIIHSVTGPNLDGCSVWFAEDFFQTFERTDSDNECSGLKI